MTLSTRDLRRLCAHRIGGPAVTLAGTFAAYFLLARFSHAIVDASSGVAEIWPPNGLVVGLVVLLPPRLRLWALAAVLPGELAADLLQGFPVLGTLGWGATNTLESALAGWILLMVARRRPLGNRTRDFFALACAATLAPLVGGLLGAAVEHAYSNGSYSHAWLTWWLGDGLGILLIVPLAISFARAPARRTPRQRLEGLAELGLVVGGAAAVFGFATAPIEMLVFPPLVLIAVRQGLRLTTFAAVVLAAVAAVFSGRDRGPLADVAGTDSSVLELQILVATIAFVAFLISATIAERRSAEQALVELATHDFLTGLANRRRFVERLDQVAARRDRSAEGAAVVYFDLDGFKQINDTHGHAVGDAVLVEVGRRLAAVVRESDFVARIGGDEFVALLEPVADIRDADTFARRIATAIGRPCEVGGVSIPIGVATGSALVGSDSGQSLARADVRLYRNKRVRASRPAARAQE